MKCELTLSLTLSSKSYLDKNNKIQNIKLAVNHKNLHYPSTIVGGLTVGRSDKFVGKFPE